MWLASWGGSLPGQLRYLATLFSYVFWTSRALRDRTILPCTGFSTDSTSSSGWESTFRCLIFVCIDFWCCRGSGGSVGQSVGISINFSLLIELPAEAPPLSGGSAEVVVVLNWGYRAKTLCVAYISIQVVEEISRNFDRRSKLSDWSDSCQELSPTSLITW
jgi:hypothetical protein